MNTWLLVLAAALLTYASRAGALALLPAPSGRFRDVIGRVPAPLFAGLAVYALLGNDLTMPPLPTQLSVLGALVVTPRRSLALVLAAGLTAYAIGVLATM